MIKMKKKKWSFSSFLKRKLTNMFSWMKWSNFFFEDDWVSRPRILDRMTRHLPRSSFSVMVTISVKNRMITCEIFWS